MFARKLKKVKTAELIDTPEFLYYKKFFFNQIGYQPHKYQRMFHESPARFKIMIAGARGGKSMCAGYEAAPHLLLPDFRIWCAAATYDLAEKEYEWCLDALSKYYFNGRPVLEYGHHVNQARGQKAVHFPWGSFIETKSTQKMESLLGEELDMVIIGEAAQMPLRAWVKFLRPRIGPRRGKALIPSTGAGDFGFLPYCIDHAKSPSRAYRDWEMIQFTTLDNPTFSRAEYEAARMELDRDAFAEQYEGKLVSKRGRVFRNFSDAHITNELPEDFEEMPVICAFRSGIRNPTIGVWATYDSRRREYLVYAEYNETDKLMHDLQPYHEKYTRGRRVVIGPFADVRDRACIKGIEDMGLIAHKIEAESKISEKMAVIHRVRNLLSVLKPRENKPPRLRVHASCEKLIDEFRKCRWPEKKREEAEAAEIEVPMSKYFQATSAVAQMIAFFESTVLHGDVYGAQ